MTQIITTAIPASTSSTSSSLSTFKSDTLSYGTNVEIGIAFIAAVAFLPFRRSKQRAGKARHEKTGVTEVEHTSRRKGQVGVWSRAEMGADGCYDGT